MEVLGCIIVDDDEFSTTLMRGLVQRTQGLELRGEYSSAIDALNALGGAGKEAVNLIFLDIEMPEMSGIEFVRAIDTSNREVVIYSSQEKYALESYEYDVCDYLLKPVTYARFIRAVTKVRQSLGLKQVTTPDNEEGDEAEGLYVRDNKGELHNVRYTDIVSVEARENYVAVKTPHQEHVVHITLKKLIEDIPEQYVIRVHRSYLVGRRYIASMGKDKVTLNVNGVPVAVPLSRSCSANVRQELGLN